MKKGRLFSERKKKGREKIVRSQEESLGHVAPTREKKAKFSLPRGAIGRKGGLSRLLWKGKKEKRGNVGDASDARKEKKSTPLESVSFSKKKKKKRGRRPPRRPKKKKKKKFLRKREGKKKITNGIGALDKERKKGEGKSPPLLTKKKGKRERQEFRLR